MFLFHSCWSLYSFQLTSLPSDFVSFSSVAQWVLLGLLTGGCVSFFFFKLFTFALCVCIIFLHACLCSMFMPGVQEAKRKHLIPWIWSYTLLPTMWVLEIKLRSSEEQSVNVCLSSPGKGLSAMAWTPSQWLYHGRKHLSIPTNHCLKARGGGGGCHLGKHSPLHGRTLAGSVLCMP